MRYTFFIWILSFLFFSCNRTNPFVPKNNVLEVVPSFFVQNILLENVQAEWSNATVSTTQLLDSIQKQYPHRIKISTFHLNDWLSNSTTQDISDYLGGYINIPVGAANRHLTFNTINQEDNRIWMTPINWFQSIDQQINQESSAALAMQSGINERQEAYATVYIAYKKPFASNTRLSLYVVRDSIKHIFQVDASPSFFHKNIFTNIYPDSIVGVPISLHESNDLGTIASYTFSPLDIQSIDIYNYKLVAVLHEANTDFRKRRIINVQDALFGGIKYWDEK
ncbi:MAG: Omp28-related outer membrane protein [Chitinophagaceae bacterium]